MSSRSTAGWFVFFWMSHDRKSEFTCEDEREGMESTRRVPAILLAALLTVMTLTATASASTLVHHPTSHHRHSMTRPHKTPV
jgi:hypothetical protein